MENMQRKLTQAIKESYETPTQEQTDVNKLLKLDQKVKAPAEIFAYAFGSVGALVLGGGMSLAMTNIGATLGALAMPIGICVGVVGLAMVSANYFIYKSILKRRKDKYRAEILELSSRILGE